MNAYDTIRDVSSGETVAVECPDVLTTVLSMMKSILLLLDSTAAPADVGAFLDHAVQRLHDHLHAANDDDPAAWPS